MIFQTKPHHVVEILKQNSAYVRDLDIETGDVLICEIPAQCYGVPTVTVRNITKGLEKQITYGVMGNYDDNSTVLKIEEIED